MKRILLLLFCAVSLAASAQNAYDDNLIVLDSSSADSTIVWFEKFRPNQAWSLDVEYTGLNDSIQFAIVISNFNNGSFGYYPLNNIIFPLKLDPIVDLYRGTDGIMYATYTFTASKIAFTRFGILIIKSGYVLGNFKYRFKQ